MAAPQPSSTGDPSAPEPGTATWWAERGARLARRRRRPDGLTVERIVERAVQLVDDEGLAELTVRRLAQALGTGSASLYRHVASRDELLVLMVDHVIGEVDLGTERLSGRGQAEWLSHELRRVLLRHRQLLPALTAAPLLGPNAIAGIDAGLRAFAGMGLDGSAVVPACLALIDFVLGAVYFETGRGAAEMQMAVGAVGGPVGDHPSLLAHRERLTSVTAGETFTFGLRAFLDGLTGAG